MRSFKNLYPSYDGIDLSINLFVVQIARDLNSFNLNMVNINSTSKHLVHFIMVAEKQQLQVDDERLRQIHSAFWSMEVLNAAVVFYSDSLYATSYNPFLPPESKLSIYEPFETTIHSLFPDQTADLNGHPLVATAFYDEMAFMFDEFSTEYPSRLNGTDGFFMALLIDLMNATLKIVSPADRETIGEILNGNITGTLGQLARREADIAANIRSFRLQEFKDIIETTIPTDRDDICILVPRPGKVTDIANIFRAFDGLPWLCIALAIPIFSITYWLIYIAMPHHHLVKETLVSVFFRVCGWNLGQASDPIPRHWLKRILIGTWLLYCFFIIALYQGKLSGTLIIPKDKPDIASFRELMETDFKILSLSRFNRQIRAYFDQERFHGKYDRLKSRLVDVDDETYLTEIRRHNQSIAFAHKSHVNAYHRRLYREQNEVIYSHMKKCPVPYVAVYGLKAGSPYKGRIDFILRRAQEGGLYEKWGRTDRSEEKLTRTKFKDDQHVVPFTWSHMQSLFYLYFVGLIISVLGFCGEIILFNKVQL